tara:strand:- start:1810 stop:2889 length:1080 start_codon:yes stop_codon:yes gene_type:complete
MKIPKYYPIFESTYSEEIASEQIFILKYEKLPSVQSYKMPFTEKVLEVITKDGFSILSKLSSEYQTIIRTLIGRTSQETLYNCDEKELLIKTKRTKGNKSITLTFYYSHDNGTIESQYNISKFKKHITKKKKGNISLIKSQSGGFLDLEEYELNIPKTDLKLNYGDEFKKIHETIVKRLNNNNDKGIVLLHGEPGTGKTTYIKYLSSLIKEKQIIFVPPMMAESLTDPTIIPFLMEYKNSILIIEDAEKVLGTRESSHNMSQSTSNLLNLTDGILGDCLNIQIVATFNTKRDNIDDAFMRKGRLIAEHKFKKLSIEESNKLLSSLSKDVVAEEEMALSDIYNIDVDIYKTIKEKGKIGF